MSRAPEAGVMNGTMWVLGTEPKSSARATGATEPLSLHSDPIPYFLNTWVCDAGQDDSPLKRLCTTKGEAMQD